MSQKQALQIALAIMALAIIIFLMSRKRETEERRLIEDVNSNISFDGPY